MYSTDVQVCQVVIEGVNANYDARKICSSGDTSQTADYPNP